MKSLSPSKKPLFEQSSSVDLCTETAFFYLKKTGIWKYKLYKTYYVLHNKRNEKAKFAFLFVLPNVQIANVRVQSNVGG